VFAVIPIVVGPLQVLLALLPAILFAIGSVLLALFKPRTVKLLAKLVWRMKLSVLIGGAVVTGLVYGARAYWPRGPVTAVEKGTGDWAVFRGGAHRTGVVPGAASPAAGGINWTFTGEGKTYYSSPTVVGNRIYVTTADVGVFASKGAILCLDADTGAVVWRTAPPGYRATFSSPSVSGKYLVVGEGLHFTKDARIICLDIEQNGKVVWTYRTGCHVESSPCISDGRVYVGAGDDGYRCLQLEPDAQGNPVVLWHLKGDQYPDAETSPVVQDGKVYFGLGLGGQAVVCADATTGNEIWRVPTSGPVFTAPTVANGKVFVGMGFGDFVNAEEQAIAKRLEKLKQDGKSAAEIEAARKQMKVTGEVLCVDVATKSVAWKFTTDRTVLGCVVAGEDRVFCATRGGTVYALSYDGRELARWNARSPIIASPALTERYLYIVTDAGRLFALDRSTLQPVWEVAVSGGAGNVSSPAVARGKVYVGTVENGLVCAGQPNEAVAPAILSGNTDDSPLPDRGSLIWRWPKSEDENAAAPVVTGLWAGGKRLAARTTGPGRSGVVVLPLDSAKREAPVEVAFEPGNKTPLGMLSTTGDVVFPKMDDEPAGAVSGPFRITAGEELICADRITSKPLWRVKLPAPATCVPVMGGTTIYVGTESQTLAYRLVDGAPLWQGEVGATTLTIAGSTLVAVSAAGDLAVFDIETGKVRYRQAEALPNIKPIIAGEMVLYATKENLMALRSADGETQRWMATGWLGNMTASPVLVDSSVYFATDQFGLIRAGRRR